MWPLTHSINSQVLFQYRSPWAAESSFFREAVKTEARVDYRVPVYPHCAPFERHRSEMVIAMFFLIRGITKPFKAKEAVFYFNWTSSYAPYDCSDFFVATGVNMIGSILLHLRQGCWHTGQAPLTGSSSGRYMTSKSLVHRECKSYTAWSLWFRVRGFIIVEDERAQAWSDDNPLYDISPHVLTISL